MFHQQRICELYHYVYKVRYTQHYYLLIFVFISIQREEMCGWKRMEVEGRVIWGKICCKCYIKIMNAKRKVRGINPRETYVFRWTFLLLYFFFFSFLIFISCRSICVHEIFTYKCWFSLLLWSIGTKKKRKDFVQLSALN